MRYRTSIALAALSMPVALLLGACSQPSADRLNQEGNQSYARGEYPAALESYRRAQVERPDLPGLNYNAGNVLYQQGEYQRGVTETLRATKVGDIDVRAHAYYTIGADYYREGKLQEALDAYKNALRIDSGDLDAKYNVEVIQRRLDKEAADRKAQQDQNAANPPQSQDPQPQATPQSQDPNQQQGQQPQASPQSGQRGQAGQPRQPGQQGQQPGQQQGQQAQQTGSSNPGLPGGAPQPGQSSGANPAPGAPAQGQPGASQPSQQGQPGGSAAQGPGGAPQGSPGGQLSPGGTPVPGTAQADAAAQLRQLEGALQDAQKAYSQSPSIEQALRILDIIAQEQSITQTDRSNRTDPRTTDK